MDLGAARDAWNDDHGVGERDVSAADVNLGYRIAGALRILSFDVETFVFVVAFLKRHPIGNVRFIDGIIESEVYFLQLGSGRG